jgi:hypothetical protein
MMIFDQRQRERERLIAHHYKANRHQFKFAVACAWCRRTKVYSSFMFVAPSVNGDTITHGICPCCTKKELKKLKEVSHG